MKCTTSQGQFLKWSEKHEDLRFVDKSVEIIKQFQHYIGSAGGGGGKTTHIAYYPLKPLNIKLDKVSCTTYTVPQ